MIKREDIKVGQKWYCKTAAGVTPPLEIFEITEKTILIGVMPSMFTLTPYPAKRRLLSKVMPLLVEEVKNVT